MPAARQALQTLVATKEDVADYWAELGRVQLALGAQAEAYDAFGRAHELNRTDVESLRELTAIALRIGKLEFAEAHARQLELFAPEDPRVTLTKGYSALERSDFDAARAHADRLIVASPLDSSAKILKARALVGEGRLDEAAGLLAEQVRLRPGETGCLRALGTLQLRRDDWKGLAETSRALIAIDPGNTESALWLIEAELRLHDFAAARAASLRLLTPAAAPDLVRSVLNLWAELWPAPQRVEDALRLGRPAPLPARVVYAEFLNQVGSPRHSLALIADSARLPVTAANAAANAAAAQALAMLGKTAQAKSRFDTVLEFDSGMPAALRGRAELGIRSGRTTTALIDAQKLASVSPATPRDRLLLARSYAATGDVRQAQRTLWQAFHQIPASPVIYAALAQTTAGDAERRRQLEEEFGQQRDARLRRGLGSWLG